MAINPNLNYAQAYENVLVSYFYQQGLYFSDLYNSPSNDLFSYAGAKHIHVPDLSVNEGRRNRDRSEMVAGKAGTNFSNDYVDYPLDFERYWQTLVDPSDVDETDGATAIGNITKYFNLQQKLPELDRYMSSKLFQEKQAIDGGDGINNVELTEDNVLEEFDKMMEHAEENRVNGDKILYITPHVYRMLKNAQLKNRNAILNGNGGLNRSVTSLDEVNIVKVPSDLMQTAYDFSVGAKTIDNSQQIEMFLITNGVQIAPQKYSYVGFSDKSALTSGNILYYEQSYGDVFLLKQKSAGIEFYVSPTKTGKSKNDTGSSKKS